MTEETPLQSAVSTHRSMAHLFVAFELVVPVVQLRLEGHTFPHQPLMTDGEVLGERSELRAVLSVIARVRSIDINKMC